MSLNVSPHAEWAQVSEFIADKMGLHFPPERYADLERGIAGVAKEFGFADPAACIDWLLRSPLTKVQLQSLASQLTIGETYFFREKRTFAALTQSALPALIRSRRDGTRRLRLWSAACCTGEEPYSLAILLNEVVPDLPDWHVTILATDINGRFLQKAATGVYGEWSFRDSPPWLKERYFQRTGDGRYEILPKLRKLVTFAHLNLVEDNYPALATDTNAMDIIFCRNVLMYFTPSQAAKAVQNLHCALTDGGWLAVSPCETSQTLFSRFAPVISPGVILYQKSDANIHAAPSPVPPISGESVPVISPTFELPAPLPVSALAEEPVPAEALPPVAVATSLYQEGRYAEATATLLGTIDKSNGPNPQAFSLLTRALANQGKLADAIVWCDRWVAADKLDASGHYLRAVVLQELGDVEQSRRSLQRATYLQPEFVLAHFALGNLARACGKNDEASKHFNNASHLLNACPFDKVIPESDGLTVGRLNEMISSIAAGRFES